jgi:hypothetical protein
LWCGGGGGGLVVVVVCKPNLVFCFGPNQLETGILRF